MEDFVYYNDLFDIYGDLLTIKEQNIFKDYYQEDLSLSEIANEKKISRSAVQKTVKVVLDKLQYYEDKLHINKRNEKIRNLKNISVIEDLKKGLDELLIL